MNQQTQTVPEMQQQAGKVLTQIAGYVGVRTIDMGLRFGLFSVLAQHPQGLRTEELAMQTDTDPFYMAVWCRAAYASEVLELGENETYRLAPHMQTLLLDDHFAGYIGALPGIVLQAEFFDKFAANFRSGERIWWDQCSPEFIQGVSGTGQAFYTRLIPSGLGHIPGLVEQLDQPRTILELASGSGTGLVRLAQAYPHCHIVGMDGDEYSLEVASKRTSEAGVSSRVRLQHGMLEELDGHDAYDVVLINISMHECRDIEKVTANVYQALKPGGWFVISDFPFPDTTEACRTVPARIMCGIQFFEALIDDQLLPTQAFVDLLHRHHFQEIASFDLAPVHAVIHGQKSM